MDETPRTDAVESMAIALDMAQAYIRAGVLDRNIVLNEIDMALLNSPVKMDALGTNRPKLTE